MSKQALPSHPVLFRSKQMMFPISSTNAFNDLKSRVEAWKGLDIAALGSPICSTAAPVLHECSDSPRQMQIYLFERMLLCCVPRSCGKVSLKGRLALSDMVWVSASSRAIGGQEVDGLTFAWTTSPQSPPSQIFICMQSKETCTQWATEIERLHVYESACNFGPPSFDLNSHLSPLTPAFYASHPFLRAPSMARSCQDPLKTPIALSPPQFLPDYFLPVASTHSTSHHHSSLDSRILGLCPAVQQTIKQQ